MSEILELLQYPRLAQQGSGLESPRSLEDDFNSLRARMHAGEMPPHLTVMLSNIESALTSCEQMMGLWNELGASVDALVDALAGKADADHGHSMAEIADLVGALVGKADALHGHAINDITGLSSALSGLSAAIAMRPAVYLGGTEKSNARLFCKAVTTTGGAGSAVFHLTSDGTASGAALFDNVYDETVDFEVNDSSNGYRYSWVLSVDKKTLTATVTRQAPLTLLGIPLLGGLNPTPAGTVVRVTLWGDKA